MALIKKQQRQQKCSDTSVQDGSALLAQLGSSDAATRRTAARLLPGVPDVPEACAALAACLAEETDLTVRAALLTALARIGGADATDALLSCLRSEDASLRNGAIEVLATMPAEMTPVMDDLLADAEPDVRIFAVNILQSLRHPQVESWLIAVIETDAHVNVCACAVDLLVEVGTAAAVPALAELRGRFADEPYLQFAIGLALGRCGAQNT